MTMIPPAPAAAGPAPASGSSAATPPSGDGAELALAFAALVEAIGTEFAAGEAAGDESPAGDAPLESQPVENEGTADETTPAALVAVLLAASTARTSIDGTSSLTGDLDGVPTVNGATVSTQDKGVPLTASTDLDAALATADAADAEVETQTEVTGATDETVPDRDIKADAAVDTEPELSVDAGTETETETGVETEVESDAPTGADLPAADEGATSDAGADGADPVLHRPTTANTTAPDSAGAAGSTSASSSTTAVDGPAAAAPSARTPAPALPDQLVSVLTPLRRGPDGTHRVAIQLRPDELGEVMVDVRVKGNEISLNVRADLAGTADLLRASLGDLRAELEAAGFEAGDLDVAGHGTDGTADDRTGDRTDDPTRDRSSLGHSSATIADGDQTDLPTATSVSGLDLRL